MKFWITILFTQTLTLHAWALKSSIPASVAGLDTANVHEIAPGIFRGMTPHGDMSDLLKMDIQNVLIFKTETSDEVQDEFNKLKELGYKKSSIKHIPFRWSQIDNYSEACEQTAEALNYINKKQKEGAVYFHCTVGEDRTGLLAGLYRMSTEGLSLQEVFQDEMCSRGYEAGNANKPFKVVKAIRNDLTPLFVAMAQLIEEHGKITRKMCQDLTLPDKSVSDEYFCK